MVDAFDEMSVDRDDGRSTGCRTRDILGCSGYTYENFRSFGFSELDETGVVVGQCFFRYGSVRARQ